MRFILNYSCPGIWDQAKRTQVLKMMACVHASNWVTLTSLISTLSPTHLMSHDIWQDIYNMNHSIMFRWHGWLSCLSSYSMKIKYLPIWSPMLYHETSQWVFFGWSHDKLCETIFGYIYILDIYRWIFYHKISINLKCHHDLFPVFEGL